MVYVVGVGPGLGLYLTRAGENIIKKAKLIIGGARNIDLIRSSLGISSDQEVYSLGANLANMMDKIRACMDEDIAVLASGDPSVYGIADYIKRNMPACQELEIVPGISSIQYAFSAFQIPMNDLYISSSHGRQPDYDLIFMHDKVAILTDSKIGPREIAQEVKKRGLGYTFYVGENLSYPDQRLTVANADHILDRQAYDMCLVILVKWRSEDEE